MEKKKIKLLINNKNEDKPKQTEKPKRPLNEYQKYIKNNYERVKKKLIGGKSTDIISALAFEYNNIYKNKKRTFDNKTLNF